MRRLARPSRNVLMDFGAWRRLCSLLIQITISEFIWSSRNMHLWRKMRRVWISVSQRLKPHKPTVKGGKDGEACNANGLLKLEDDVMMCGYEDVQVMWKLLNSPQMERIGAAAAAAATTTTVSPLSRRKHWSSSWMAIIWPNHRNTSSPSSSPSSFGWVKSS
ncbi:uncharacterized protein LOC120203822 [Hibiscus syriacus]|uniref:uncharacterized protein LOC120203822 n=1 Tax=Hibiscus syriacus TaxID=106335 RepID=UPI001920746A|nr:uncharacterized protein LOC120203822 [Hibiscus syriacus]